MTTILLDRRISLIVFHFLSDLCPQSGHIGAQNDWIG
jgi:hypothetical protein